jgi:hypothetical protein
MPSSWKQQGLTIIGDAVGGKLGRLVALSAKSSILAIWASGYNNDLGQVKVYCAKDDGRNRGCSLARPSMVMPLMIVSESA